MREAATASLISLSDVTTDARTVGKTVDLRLVSVTDRPTNCVVGHRRRGVDVTASTGTDFGEKVSSLGSGVLLWGPILKRELQAETTARCTRSTGSSYQAWLNARGVVEVGESPGLSGHGYRFCGCRVEGRQDDGGNELPGWTEEGQRSGVRRLRSWHRFRGSRRRTGSRRQPS